MQICEEHIKLALGTAQFGLDYGISNPEGKTPETEVNAILEYAYSKGIDNIDTAYSYGSGEAAIGRYLDNHSDEKWKVISKLPRLKEDENVGSDFNNYFDKSKSRLGKSLHTYLAHDAEQFVYDLRVRNKFISLKGQGAINRIGVSVYTAEEIVAVLDIDEVDVIQLPLNILDHRLVNAGCVSRAPRE